MKIQGRKLFITISAFFISMQAHARFAEHVAGEYVIQLKKNAPLQSMAMTSLQASLGAHQLKIVSQNINTVLVQRSVVESAESVIQELKSHPMVAVAEPNYIYRASLLPNDSRLGELWGLLNQNKAAGGVDIDAEKAWDITTGSRDIVVAVIDTGINYKDPELMNNMWINEAEANGQPGVDDDGNGFIDDIYGYDFANNDGDPMDDNNHGSHCAGTIGAEGNNGIGVVGVNWQVKMMALKFLKGNGGGTLEGAIQAIDYATAQNVDIMSNSWGGGGASETLKAAIERAEQAGILFVAAAGNNRSNNDIQPMYPASYEVSNVVSVAAVGSRGELASFSNYGKTTVDIAAPGVDILSTGKSDLIKLSGTSMATPHVSGVAALLLAKNPDMTYAEMQERMYRTSTPSAILRSKIANGLLNAYNALADVVPPADPNDPNVWDSRPENVSTDHPYADAIELNHSFTVEGASKVSVYFSKFDTEKGYDKVFFYDKNGTLLGEMSGPNNDSFSPVAEGDTITLKFVSDKSINRYGFDITKVSFKIAE